jgi:PadR family transcriptional regulator, regulatory protein PadR
LHERTGDGLRVEEGSLYPALYRMERDGWIDAEWGTSELGRKAKFYRITPKGRRQLKAQASDFAQFVALVTPILLPTA